MAQNKHAGVDAQNRYGPTENDEAGGVRHGGSRTYFMEELPHDVRPAWEIRGLAISTSGPLRAQEDDDAAAAEKRCLFNPKTRLAGVR